MAVEQFSIGANNKVMQIDAPSNGIDQSNRKSRPRLGDWKAGVSSMKGILRVIFIGLFWLVCFMIWAAVVRADVIDNFLSFLK